MAEIASPVNSKIIWHYKYFVRALLKETKISIYENWGNILKIVLFFMFNWFNLILIENDSQLLISGYGRLSGGRRQTLGQAQIKFYCGGSSRGWEGKNPCQIWFNDNALIWNIQYIFFLVQYNIQCILILNISLTKLQLLCGQRHMSKLSEHNYRTLSVHFCVTFIISFFILFNLVVVLTS